MNPFFYWSGVTVWAAAALTIAWWVVQIIGEVAGKRMSFGKFNAAQPIFGRHPGNLATLVPPHIHLRIPYTSHGFVYYTVNERRWARRWAPLTPEDSNDADGSANAAAVDLVRGGATHPEDPNHLPNRAVTVQAAVHANSSQWAVPDAPTHTSMHTNQGGQE